MIFKKKLLIFTICVSTTTIFPPPVFSVPVSTSREFVEYLNSDQSWNGNYKFKFNWLSECYKKHNSAGRAMAFICTNGVVDRTSPTGIKASCRVSKVRINRKSKISLTTTNC